MEMMSYPFNLAFKARLTKEPFIHVEMTVYNCNFTIGKLYTLKKIKRWNDILYFPLDNDTGKFTEWITDPNSWELP